MKLSSTGFFWWSDGKLDGDAWNEKLNQLGSEGWELISVFGTHLSGGATRDVFAVLKRPAQ